MLFAARRETVRRPARSAARAVRLENGAVWLLPPALVVRIANPASARKAREKFRLTARKSGIANVELWVSNDGSRDGGTMAIEMQSIDGVSWLEPLFLEPLVTRQRPNDPDLLRQWLHGDSDWPGDAPGGIGTFSVWRRYTGRDQTIAVIDGAFDLFHPELGGIPHHPQSGSFEIDAQMADVDFKLGYTPSGQPTASHGTQCAAMAVGRLNNYFGGAGTAPEARLMAIGTHGLTKEDPLMSQQIGIAAALIHAANRAEQPYDGPGADVITCSLGPNLGGWTLSAPLKEAIEAVANDGKGPPLFWAVANGHEPVRLDGVCSHPDVIAVGRSDKHGQNGGAAYGPELAFLAPGVDVLLPVNSMKTSPTTGTSFSAPCAAGVAALLRQAKPSLTGADIRSILIQTCDKIGTEPYTTLPNGTSRNDVCGAGKINAAAALASIS